MVKRVNASVNTSPDIIHPDEVITFKRGIPLSTTRPYDQASDNRPGLPATSVGQPFDFNVGDHLFIFAALTSGFSQDRMSNYFNVDSQFFLGAQGELTMSSHGYGFGGDGVTNDNSISATPNFGFGWRCSGMYVDRTNGAGRGLQTTQDGTDPFIDTFLNIIPFVQGADWNDAVVGNVAIDFGFNSKFLEHGSIRAIKWTDGNQPPIAVIERALEWMWYNWYNNDVMVLYPELLQYTND